MTILLGHEICLVKLAPDFFDSCVFVIHEHVKYKKGRGQVRMMDKKHHLEINIFIQMELFLYFILPIFD